MLTGKEHIKLSKFLSLVLRHRPELIGIALDEQGCSCSAQGKTARFGLEGRSDLLRAMTAENPRKPVKF